MLSVTYALAALGCFLSATLIAPVLVALLAGEADVAGRLFLYFGLGVFAFGAPLIATMGRARRPDPAGQLVTLILGWTLLPLVMAVPLADVGKLPLLDAMFESVSAYTTAGASTVKVADALPQGVLFLRAQAQWIGGFLAVMSIVLVLAPLGLGGLSARSATLSGGSLADLSRERFAALAWRYGSLYVLLTAICFLLLFLSGARAFHAATLAMTALSTGGILPFDRPLEVAVGPAGLVVMAGFLLIGATSVFWQRAVLTGQWALVRRHRESYAVMGTVLVVTVAFAALLAAVPGSGPLLEPLLAESFFSAASIVSTSGIESRPGVQTLMPLTVVLFLILLGGSAFGTSGGLKHYRLGGMLVRSRGELDRLVYPAIVRPAHFGSQSYDPSLMRAIWAFFWAALVTIALGTFLVTLSGLSFEPALTAAIAAFTTAGPVYEAGWGGPASPDWPLYSDMPGAAKLVLMAIMVLGRLEVLAVLGVLVLRPWSSR